MYGQCKICGKKYGTVNGMYFFKPCIHMKKEKIMKGKNWIGVDLDGTLAMFHEESYYDGEYGPETIGEPIPEMIERVKRWIKNGKTVKIFTARVSMVTADHLRTTVKDMESGIHVWLIKHLGFDLEVTNEKDCFMVELWDDIKLIQVERNVGLVSDIN